MQNRSFRIVGCLALTLAVMAGLTGCPSEQTATAPQSAPKQATAPALAPAAPAPSFVPAPVLTAEQRQAQQLIAQVERTFASGEAHYKKGQLTQAKMDFDHAVDLMLGSGLDIKSDPQLSDEFDHILDAVNAMEMQALKNGNGFAPAVEPTPADVANDVTFEVDPNLVATAKAELATTKSDLPLVINDYVAAFINFFANSQRGHNTLKHSLERGGRYKAMIQRVLNEEGVPQDLIYLAVAESGFQPQAVNGHSGAGGMWQFMPQGDYGLVRNGYVDERFDPEKSTRAYARYMKFLYNQLGDWYLAMAAYNWGAGNVQRAVQKTGYADFWELYKRNNLPGETKNYVPEILAAIIITKNPKQYGFDDVDPDAAIQIDTVPISYAVDLRLVADVIDAEPQELIALNPGLLRLITPPPVLAAPYDLHLPAGTATVYQQRIADIPEARRTQWRYHRVVPDDTLASVARTYHVSEEQLASTNQFHEGDGLNGVEALVIPVAPPAAPSVHVEVYKARRGDTMVTVADRFGVSLDDLHRWNHVTGTTVAAGQRIRVTAPAAAVAKHGSEASAKTSSKAAGKSASGKSPPNKDAAKSASTKSRSSQSKEKASTRTTGKKISTTKAVVVHKSTHNKKIQK